jgi:hypothetical protein
VKPSSPLPDPADESPIAETNAKTPPSLLHRARAFVSRNGDALMLEAIGGVVLALVVSLVVFGLDQATADQRDAQAEAQSNSIFVRQAVMGDSAILPFSSLNLRGAQLSGLPLAGADFSDADLSGAELKDTDLTGATLTEANLSGVDLSGSTLIGVNMAEAQLRNADLSGVNFTGAIVTDVDFTDAFYVDDDPPIGLSAISDLRIVEGSDTND